MTATFAAMARRYVSDHWKVRQGGRFIAMVGDAELDEGNVWESLLEEHVAGLGNLLWIVDMNRQSLDRVVPDTRRRQVADWFQAAGWRVIELRWGRRLQSIFTLCLAVLFMIRVTRIWQFPGSREFNRECKRVLPILSHFPVVGRLFT